VEVAKDEDVAGYAIVWTGRYHNNGGRSTRTNITGRIGMNINVTSSKPKKEVVKLNRGDWFGSRDSASMYLHLGNVPAHRLRDIADAVEKHGHCVGVLLQSQYHDTDLPLLHTVSGRQHVGGNEYRLRQVNTLELEII